MTTKSEVQTAIQNFNTELSDIVVNAYIAYNAGNCSTIASSVGALNALRARVVAYADMYRSEPNSDTALSNSLNNLQTTIYRFKIPEVEELQDTCKPKTVLPNESNPTNDTPTTTPTNPSGNPQPSTNRSVNAAREAAIATPSARESLIAAQEGDWRVRLSLAPDAGAILYRAPQEELVDSILSPLAETNGVLFPYTPSISTTYTAAYEPTMLVHSNYKAYNYTGSYIEAVNISCDFTAQDTFEANYVLAVIHFFRSVTKMFYGQDEIVSPGTPPPLCFLTGLGEFQFNMHPLVVSSFTYNLPNNVHYIRASNNSGGLPGTNRARAANRNNTYDPSSNRLAGQAGTGGNYPSTIWPNNLDVRAGTTPTYVPTAIQLQITAYPVISRNKVSNEFSLQQYSTGRLLQGSRINGAFW